MDSFFADLGQTVLDRWKAHNFSLEIFPEIARLALEEQPPADLVDVAGLIRDFLLDDEQPFQSQSAFGEPELVVYDHPRFYIQILFWLEGTMEIHQHQFSGAFHVLEGSSLHAHFAFEESQAITAHLRVGQLRMKDARLLETGSTVPIVSGAECIHSLFHLDTPSLSVVIRTHNDPGTGPQFTYLPPHLAVDPFQSDTLTTRRKQLLDVLERIEDADYPELVLEMLENLDFERGFYILQNGMSHLIELGRWEEVWTAFEQKHGKLADYVGPTLLEIAWRDGLVGLRASIVEPEHRFFLALLLNVPSRTQILDLVAQRFPEDPVEKILAWATELSDVSELGTWMMDVAFPLEAEMDGLEQADVLFEALRWFLQGGEIGTEPVSLGAFTASADDLELLRTAFLASSFRALLSEQ